MSARFLRVRASVYICVFVWVCVCVCVCVRACVGCGGHRGRELAGVCSDLRLRVALDHNPGQRERRAVVTPFDTASLLERGRARSRRTRVDGCKIRERYARFARGLRRRTLFVGIIAVIKAHGICAVVGVARDDNCFLELSVPTSVAPRENALIGDEQRAHAHRLDNTPHERAVGRLYVELVVDLNARTRQRRALPRGVARGRGIAVGVARLRRRKRARIIKMRELRLF